jgi:exo-1,4-beta-D-glucosaminidase
MTPERLHLQLRDGWWIQTSAGLAHTGESLSSPGFDSTAWHPAGVPCTVVGALVDDGTYPDPHFGMNLRDIPGTDYDIGTNFSLLPMPDDSPFRVPWWYRTEFTLPDDITDQKVWLHFGAINYKANVWLNGQQIAETSDTAGSWRIHEFDITDSALPGRNGLAVEVFAPGHNDLALTFVDWNPMPPDKMMGLFRPVTVATSGPVTLRHPQVVTELTALHRAALTVKVVARNTTDQELTAKLQARVGPVELAAEITLSPGEQEICLSPTELPELVLADPKLWWPAHLGDPHLYDLELDIKIDDNLSDRVTQRFGIRQFTAGIDNNGHLRFQVNGEEIQIRGAGWAPEMTLRCSPERLEQELAYVKHLGLNTIRMEGTLEDEAFFDIADREGLLVMPGWTCCCHWERWDDWTEQDLAVAVASLHDQMLRLRGRASVFVWLNGSDNPPPPHVEQAYLDVLNELGFPNPVISSATAQPAELSGPTGVKMNGPYEWVPPLYWYTDTEFGGPHGFATEISPGPAPPPVASLRRFLPESALWPINPTWEFHCGGGPFSNLTVFNAALDARYGPSASIEEYTLKAQVAAYESHRAMFESFRAVPKAASGVIQWMLNNAWPSLIWHLYDFYLRPAGSYFGARKANEPLHILYEYDDRSITVVNSTLRAFPEHRATALLVNLDGSTQYEQTVFVDVPSNTAIPVFALPLLSDLSTTYFVVLTLDNGNDAAASRNIYWLSPTTDVLAWERSDWYFTPVRRYTDMTALNSLPTAEVEATARFRTSGPEATATVTLKNSTKAIAFFVHLSVQKGRDGEEILPILWEDNYVTLLPGERHELTARFATDLLGGARPALAVEGWNVARAVVK